MTRRVTRTAPTAAGLAPLLSSVAASVQAALKPVTSRTTTPTIAQQTYTSPITTPIAGGYGSGIVSAAGTVTVRVGPMGLGTIWYPQSVAIATTTGANDPSTCTIFVGPLGLQTQTGGASFSGGASSVGLPVPAIWPGYFVIGIWTGANPGDLATLTVYGQQSALRP